MSDDKIEFSRGSITLTPLTATLTFNTEPPDVLSINVDDTIHVDDDKQITIHRPPKNYEKELLMLFTALWWIAEGEEKEGLRQALRKIIDWLAGGGSG